MTSLNFEDNETFRNWHFGFTPYNQLVLSYNHLVIFITIWLQDVTNWLISGCSILLELMIFVIGKKTPRHTHFGGNTTAKPYFGPFPCFYFIQPHELPNYARIHCLLLQYESQNIWGKSQFLGKNDQFCDYPLSD